MLRKFVAFLCIYLAINSVFAVFALALLYPFHPVTIAGSITWFLAVLPISILGEWLGGIVFGQQAGKFINRNTSGTSVGRIGYGVLVTVRLCIALGGFLYLLGEGFTAFFEKNFSDDW